MRDIGDLSTGIGSSNNSDTGIIKAIDRLTLDGEPIKFKR